MMGLVEGDESKKGKKKNKSVEGLVMVEEGKCVDSYEEKKRKNKGKGLDVIGEEVVGEKKKKEKKIELESGNDGVLKERKKARKNKVEKCEGSSGVGDKELDHDDEFKVRKDKKKRKDEKKVQSNEKKKKEKKIELESGNDDVLKERKKARKNKVEKGEGSSGVGDKELDHDDEFKVRKDKKKRKDDKKVQSNEVEEISVKDAVEECDINEKKGTKKKKKKDKTTTDDESFRVDGGNAHSIEDKQSQEERTENVDVEGCSNTGKSKKRKKNKNGEKRGTECSIEYKNNQKVASDEERNENNCVEGCSNTDSGQSKKRKKEKKNKNGPNEGVAVNDNGDSVTEGHSGSVGNKKRKREKGAVDVVTEESDKSKRKKTKCVKDVEEKYVNEEENGTGKAGDVDSGNLGPKKTSKRVKFSSKVEVFPSSDDTDVREENPERGIENLEGGLIRGKRFTEHEDALVKGSVLNYIKEHDLGDDGLKKVLRCHSYPEVRNCWKEISAAIPWRPLKPIYDRAHILFERDESRKWSREEIQDLIEFRKEHGPDWRKFADEHGKNRIHVKDTWRREGLTNKKTGPWTQDEYQMFFDLVNMDLRMKAFEEKQIKHNMLRDNIAWEAISQKLSTRTNSQCCVKWYSQLESPLVKAGAWANSDDFRLLNELLARDYSSEEEVDWDGLLEHRPGDLCRKRWRQMVNHLGYHGNKGFADIVEVLSNRYCPDVLEARVTYENRTPIDLQT